METSHTNTMIDAIKTFAQTCISSILDDAKYISAYSEARHEVMKMNKDDNLEHYDEMTTLLNNCRDLFDKYRNLCHIKKNIEEFTYQDENDMMRFIMLFDTFQAISLQIEEESHELMKQLSLKCSIDSTTTAEMYKDVVEIKNKIQEQSSIEFESLV
eukprot:762106-Hanusia_phi.AAC.1